MQAHAHPNGQLTLMGAPRAAPWGEPHHGQESGWEAIGRGYATTIMLPAIGAALAKRGGGFVKQVSSTSRWARWLGGAGAKLGGCRQVRPRQVWGPGPSVTSCCGAAARAIRAACPRRCRPRRCSVPRQTPAARCAAGAGYH